MKKLMVSRFSSIIDDLREKREALLEESRKKRRAKGAPRKKKEEKKIEFESEMLEKIFNDMPRDMQEMLRKKV